MRCDMSIAEKYYTDTAVIEVYLGTNDRGDAIFEEAAVVPCRFSYEQKEILDSKGEKTVSTASMICGIFIPSLSRVKNELNESFTVRSCEPVKRISGKIDHYEVIL